MALTVFHLLFRFSLRRAIYQSTRAPSIVLITNQIKTYQIGLFFSMRAENRSTQGKNLSGRTGPATNSTHIWCRVQNQTRGQILMLMTMTKNGFYFHRGKVPSQKSALKAVIIAVLPSSLNLRYPPCLCSLSASFLPSKTTANRPRMSLICQCF